MENGEVFSSFSNFLIDTEKIYEKIYNYKIINLSSILKRAKLFSPMKIIEFKTIEVENFNKNVEQFINTAIRLANDNQKIYVFAGSKSRKESLLQSFVDHNFLLATDEDKNPTFEKSPIIISDKKSNEGYFVKDISLHVFTSKERYEQYSWTQYCENIDYLNGWLYGCVQAINGIMKPKAKVI